MNTNKGLVLDGYKTDTPDKKWNHARNVLLTDDKMSVRTEPGFTKQFDVVGDLIGSIDTPENIISFFSIIENDITKLAVYKDAELLFKTQFIPISGNPIFGTYTYNGIMELIIVWANGVADDSDEMRYFNCTTPQVELDANKEILTDLECQKTLSNSNLNKVIYNIVQRPTGGTLKAGTYFIAANYMIDDYNETNYSYISDPFYTLGLDNNNKNGVCGFKFDSVTPCSLKVNITFENQLYKYVNLAIIYFNGTVSIVKKLSKLKINNRNGLFTVDTVITNIDNLESLDLDSIMIKMNPYIKTNEISTIKNKLVLGGVKTADSFEYFAQQAANKIYFETQIDAWTSAKEYAPVDFTFHKSFQEDEVYAFYAGFKYIKGGYISINHIPNTHILPSNIPMAESSKLLIPSTNDEEYYDDDFPQLPNQNVRHHRIRNFYQNAMKTAAYIIHGNNTMSLVAGSNQYRYMYALNLNDAANNIRPINIKISGTDFLMNGCRITKQDYSSDNLSLRGNIKLFDNFKNSDINEPLTVSIFALTSQDFTNTLELDVTDLTPDYTANILPQSVIDDPNRFGRIFEYELIMDIGVPLNQYAIVISSQHYQVDSIENVNTSIGTLTSSMLPTNREFTLRLNVNNIEIPDEFKDVCVGVDIFCAKRTMTNSRIIDQDVIHTRFWNDTMPYGQQADPNDPNTDLYQEDKNDLYSKGHAFSLLYSKANLNSIASLDVYAYDASKGASVNPVITNKGFTFVYPRTIGKTPTNFVIADSLGYIKNNNIVHNNVRGESAIKITTQMRSILPIEYGDTYETPRSYYMQFVFYFVNYISSNTNFYSNYRNQELVKLGSIDVDNIIEGDVFYYQGYNIRLSRLSADLITLPTDDTDETNIMTNMLLYPIKSQYNLAARYSGNDIQERVYPHSTFDEIMDVPTIYDNFINSDTNNGFNVGFNKRCDFYTYVNGHSKKNDSVNLSLIPVSNTQGDESKVFNWRYFALNSYKQLPFNKGMIMAILSDGIKLFIQTRFGLFVASIKDVLGVNDQQKTYLGTGDIFDRDPEEVIADKDGYIGCEHKFATTVNEAGYFVVDAMKKKIFWVSQNNICISDLDATKFFNDQLSQETIDNPYSYLNGIRLVSDNINKRVLFINNHTNTTLSFSPKGSIWVAFHDYGVFMGLSNRVNTFYYSKKMNLVGSPPAEINTISLHAQGNNENFGRYADYIANPIDANIKPSFIDVVFSSEQIPDKLLQSIIWKSDIIKNGITSYTDTIDFIMAYSRTQSTGIVPIVKANSFYFEDTALLKNDLWYFNDINDNVLDDTVAIFDNALMPTANVDKTKKAWYNRSKFIGDIFVVRFGLSSNIRNINVALSVVDLLTSKDFR